ncbi:MAG: hypothetical protein ACREQK_06865, partial [Candidatus Binatia bacterium]
KGWPRRIFDMSPRLIASGSNTWENDPWARGACVFFDSSFPPSVRRLLARRGPFPASRMSPKNSEEIFLAQ